MISVSSLNESIAIVSCQRARTQVTRLLGFGCVPCGKDMKRPRTCLAERKGRFGKSQLGKPKSKGRFENSGLGQGHSYLPSIYKEELIPLSLYTSWHARLVKRSTRCRRHEEMQIVSLVGGTTRSPGYETRYRPCTLLAPSSLL
jgi:hypothetical protein